MNVKQLSKRDNKQPEMEEKWFVLRTNQKLLAICRQYKNKKTPRNIQLADCVMRVVNDRHERKQIYESKLIL